MGFPLARALLLQLRQLALVFVQLSTQLALRLLAGSQLLRLGLQGRREVLVSLDQALTVALQVGPQDGLSLLLAHPIFLQLLEGIVTLDLQVLEACAMTVQVGAQVIDDPPQAFEFGGPDIALTVEGKQLACQGQDRLSSRRIRCRLAVHDHLLG